MMNQLVMRFEEDLLDNEKILAVVLMKVLYEPLYLTPIPSQPLEETQVRIEERRKQ